MKIQVEQAPSNSIVQKYTNRLRILCKPVHTVILEYFNIKEWALSNFAFQSFYIFIGTQDKYNFSIPMRESLGPT